MDVDPVRLAFILDDYDRLTKRVEDLEKRVRVTEAIDSRRSSIEVGTPAKGGAMKVYFDPFAQKEENDAAIAEAVRVLEKANDRPTSKAVTAPEGATGALSHTKAPSTERLYGKGGA